MAKYAVFESTNMKAVHYGGIVDALADADIENATFGYLDGLADETETEKYPLIYNFVAGIPSDAPLYVVNNPAWIENARTLAEQNRDQYIVPQGTAFRAFRVYTEDKFGVTAEAFASADRESLAVGDTVGLDANGKLTKNGSGFSGTIEYTRPIAGTNTLANKGGNLLYVIKVNTIGE